MTTRNDYTQYVHLNTRSSKPRWFVAQWVESAGQYQVPLDAETARVTGCHTEFFRIPSPTRGYTSRRRALRRARYLFRQVEL